MDKIYYTKLLNQLKNIKGQKVLFWGASLFLKSFIEENDLSEHNIVGIIDNNIEKWDTVFEGYKVYQPDKIVNFEPVYVVLTIKHNTKNVIQDITSKIYSLNLTNVYILPSVFQANNSILIVNKNGERKQVASVKELKIEFTGSNSTVEIHEDAIEHFENCQFSLGNNCKITINESRFPIRKLKAYILAKNSKLTIGKDFACVDVYIASRDESGLEISIGDDCMFSSDVYIRNSDGHTIYDIETNEVLNQPSNLKIGNHVWLGHGVCVLKNSTIPDNTIVGCNSVVNKKFDTPNIVLAGSPAKIVKQNVNWDRQNTETYLKTSFCPET